MNKSFLPYAVVFCAMGLISFLLYSARFSTRPRIVSDSAIDLKTEALVSSLTPIKEER